jgi:hypothetical protein
MQKLAREKWAIRAKKMGIILPIDDKNSEIQSTEN